MTYRAPLRLARFCDERPGETPSLVYYLRLVPGGETLALVDTAALIWEVAADGVADVPASVAEVVDIPVGEIEEDVTTYVATLVDQGLLEPLDEVPDS